MTLGYEKLSFLAAETPLEKMGNISSDFGIDFYLKRDDLTPYGTGGNKLRKLEYLVKDAVAQGATMLLTIGGAQTNHGRLTASAAARCGLKSAIIAVDEYPGEISANLLLDGIMGCHVYLVKPDSSKKYGDMLKNAINKVTSEYEEKGENVYFIPMGGSNEIGALGYYDCALELKKQIDDMKLKQPHIVTTVGSLGTYTGLAMSIAHENIDAKITGISIMPYRDIRESAFKHYLDCTEKFGLKPLLKKKDFNILTDYDCGAYNNPVKDVRESIYYMGSREGIIFDPCYTGKTFNAIRRLMKKGYFAEDESVIMIHTGGLPGIYTKHHRLEMEKELMPQVHII